MMTDLAKNKAKLTMDLLELLTIVDLLKMGCAPRFKSVRRYLWSASIETPIATRVVASSDSDPETYLAAL